MIEKAIAAALTPVLEELVRLEKRVEELQREPGPKGDKGDKGEPDIIDYQTLALTMYEQYGADLKGLPGETPEIDFDELIRALRGDFEFTEQTKGLKGDPGDKGDPGEDGAPGEKGDPGEKGEPGVDRFSMTPVWFDDGSPVNLERNAIAYYDGGVWQAIKNTVGNPSQDPGAYRLIVNGVSEAKHEFSVVERTHTLSCRLSDGKQFDFSWPDASRLRSADDGLESVAGDQRVQASMLERFDGKKWIPQISLKGEEGGRGRKGMKGDTGVGIKSMEADEGYIQFQLTGPIEVPKTLDFVNLIPSISLMLGEKDEDGKISEFTVVFEGDLQ